MFAGLLRGGLPFLGLCLGASVPQLCRPQLAGPPLPILRNPGGYWHTSCRAPAQPGVGAAPSGPNHSLPDSPLWLGACSNSRPQPSTQMEPGPAPSPGPHRDHMEGMQQAWLW